MSEEINNQSYTHECSICLSSINGSINLCTTICNHIFHTSCLLQSAQARSPPLCPLCRTNLLEVPSDYDPQRHCPRQISQNIITAYESDLLANNNIYQNLNDTLTDITTRPDTSELIYNLSPYHINNISNPITSDNIINRVIDAINKDKDANHQPTNLQRPHRHHQLSNILYNLLQNNSNLLQNNINNTGHMVASRLA